MGRKRKQPGGSRNPQEIQQSQAPQNLQSEVIQDQTEGTPQNIRRGRQHPWEIPSNGETSEAEQSHNRHHGQPLQHSTRGDLYPRAARPLFASLHPEQVINTNDLREQRNSGLEQIPRVVRTIPVAQTKSIIYRRRGQTIPSDVSRRQNQVAGDTSRKDQTTPVHGKRRRGRPPKKTQKRTQKKAQRQTSTPIDSQQTQDWNQGVQTLPSSIETSCTTPRRVQFTPIPAQHLPNPNREEVWDQRLQRHLNDSTTVQPSNSPQEEEEEEREEEELESDQSNEQAEETDSSGSSQEGITLSGKRQRALQQENKYLMEEYHNLKAIFSLLQQETHSTQTKSSKDKARIGTMAKQIERDLATSFKCFEHNSRLLRRPVDYIVRSTHYQMMTEIEQWIKEGQNISGNNSALSILEKTTSLIPSGTDRGDIQVHVGTETQEITDVSMPRGFFDPKVTEPTQLEIVRKTISSIKIPDFDGTPATGSWESWWKLFKEKIHQFPDYLIPESNKLHLLVSSIKGKPRELLRLDKPSTITNDSAYPKIIRQLHQLYGKRTFTSDEISLQIHKLELKNYRDQDSCIIFLNELDDLTIQFIQSGEPINSAYDTAIRRMLNCISDFHRREVLRAHQGVHSESTTSHKRFFDYKDWLIEFMSQNKSKRNPNQKPKTHHSKKTPEQTKKNHQFSKGKYRKQDQKPKEGSSKKDFKGFKRVFVTLCQLHKKPAHHSPLECELKWEDKLKVCKEKKICCICQESGHFANKCPNRKAVNHIKRKHQSKKTAEKQKADTPSSKETVKQETPEDIKPG